MFVLFSQIRPASVMWGHFLSWFWLFLMKPDLGSVRSVSIFWWILIWFLRFRYVQLDTLGRFLICFSIFKFLQKWIEESFPPNFTSVKLQEEGLLVSCKYRFRQILQLLTKSRKCGSIISHYFLTILSQNVNRSLPSPPSPRAIDVESGKKK